MLLGNLHTHMRTLAKFYGQGPLCGARTNFNQGGVSQNIYVGEAGILLNTGIPNGVRSPHTWLMPREDGGLASFKNAEGTSNISDANLAGGKNAEADLTGLGEFASAVMQLIVSAAANIDGLGQVTSANVVASLAAVAALEGTGTFEGDIVALANAVAALAGTTGQDLLLTATGTLTSDITPFTELSPESLASAVWNAMATEYGDTGTMGKALQDASAAGNPWAALLSSNKDAGSFGEHIQKLLTTGKFIGLK